ncbi:MAG: SDR family oxidoreductase [Methylobacteriaceae bacterium]|nr:SDR family oxidoreductase [Methylobacteriaceae bacterium]
MPKTVVITGAGSGIGFACAEHLLSCGWCVALIDRDAAALEKARGALGHPQETLPFCLDVTDEAAVNEAIASAGKLGPVRGLINSAAIGADQSFEATSVESFRRILDVNVVGCFIVARAAIGPMRDAGGGAIVNLASVSGLRGNIGRTAYGASKGAIVTMTQVMAVELAAANIRVNAIAPGPIETAMVRVMHTPEARENWMSRVPQRRYGESHEIARAAAFLLDEEQSGYVTGHVLAVDGGFLAGGLLPQ